MLHSGVDISKLDKETFKYYFILNEVTVNVMCFLLLLVLFVFVVLFYVFLLLLFFLLLCPCSNQERHGIN